MLKHIFIGFALFAVIALALVAFGVYKVADKALQLKEPQLRQYMQLSDADKDAFIMSYNDETLSQIAADPNATPESKVEAEIYMRNKDNPELKTATINMFRSLIATAIIHSDAIVKDMSADVKAQYDKEADKLSDSLEKYDDVMKALGKPSK